MRFYKLATNGLTCLDCNENNRNCRGLVVQYGTIGIEPCSTRCFIRRARDLGNSKFPFVLKFYFKRFFQATIRGCDIRYWPQPGVSIPNNGCAVLNGEQWCWCDFDDLCNFFDEKTLAVLSGG